jgi:ABC-2 type transport system ATP-binding protein
MITIEHLSFSYNQQQPLFNQLHLTLSSGSIYGLMGRNGAGKTTLLKLMAGLLFPKYGKLDVVGFNPKDRYPQFLQEVYLIAEEFTLPAMSIQNFVRLYSPFYPRFSVCLFKEYINEFNLSEKQMLSSLSYGQKKNFLLSFGLATDCKLLILDEPTNGLDIPSKRQFRKILTNAIHEERSFIISTHQARDMENLIDPIIVLDEGKIVFFESCERISNKLSITRLAELPEDKSLVYYESFLGGYTVVKENTDKEETNMNLELLFNAIINNKEKINELFKN